MSMHCPLTGSAASQRFHWYAYVIGNAPFQLPMLAVRKSPSVGAVSPNVRLTVG